MYQKRNNELEILTQYLGNYKHEFYLREISRITNIPLKTSQDAVKNLHKNRILLSRTHGKNKYFRLNLENIRTKYMLVRAELHKTDKFLAKYSTLKLFTKELNTYSCVVIFGSYARYDSDRKSDLDVMTIPDAQLPKHLLPTKLHQIQLTRRGFVRAMNKKETVIQEIMKDHVILNNHSFFVERKWNHEVVF